MKKQEYDDIIDLPHHVSQRYRQMSRKNRAAQFAPFAALTGYEASVKEEARLTEKRTELMEEQYDALNRKTAYLMKHVSEAITVSITYFLLDKKKSGGRYVTACGVISEVDEVEGVITMTDKKKIPMSDILSIDSDIFEDNTFTEI